MSSRNHPAFSSVGSWLYQAVLGLRQGDAASDAFSVPGLPPGQPAATNPSDGVGWSRVTVAPEVVTNPAVPSAAGGVWTSAGWVGASWAYASSNRQLAINASIPVGARGTIKTPLGEPWSPARITISQADGMPVWRAGAFVPGVQGVWSAEVCGRTLSRVCVAVASGNYELLVVTG